MILDLVAESICDDYKPELEAFTKVHEDITLKASPVRLLLLVNWLNNLFELFVCVSYDLSFPVEAGKLIHFIFLLLFLPMSEF